MKDFWNSRYSEQGFAYGTEPNEFLVEQANLIKKGSRILCVSEGEGRNALFLASLGHDVTAMDISSVGLEKAEERAKELNLIIKTETADLNDFDMGDSRWDAVVSIFGHLSPELRSKIHKNVIRSLKSGGIFLLESYTPEQMMLKTGGPKEENMMMSLKIIEDELAALNTIIKRTCIRDIHEGKYHNGLSAVVQYIGKKT